MNASSNALPLARRDVLPPPEQEFEFTDFRVFTSVPDHRDFGIAVLRGIVVIYDVTPLHREGVIEGAFYVRESQRPPSGMGWDRWLKHEWEDRQSNVGPVSPLKIDRQVVQAVRWPGGQYWALRLAGGFTDGPISDWSFGQDLIGKVVGIYRPQTGGANG